MVDTGGACGIWDPTTVTPEGLEGILTKAGTTLTLTIPGTSIVLTPVGSTASTLTARLGAPPATTAASSCSCRLAPT